MFNYNTQLLASSSSNDESESRFLGIGQTMSCTSSGQNSQILSCKYHCLVNDRPSGVMTLGRLIADGFQKLLLVSFILCSFSRLHDFLTYTEPHDSDENQKCVIFLMPFKADLITCPSKKLAQS